MLCTLLMGWMVTWLGRYMARYFKQLWQNQDGAVSVDWVVLTAMIVGLIAAAFSGVEGGVAALTTKLMEYLQNLTVGV
ncbi:Flp family type IVb pilin [Roseovarius sp. EL26]|uniref:Flp family type IVb pilin n=1 Tax=Roseovarius sp. EL26 TaxID=2126672 RepID=UPI0020B13334|nr:hypothetical protein [Roseovarius sp. EL26]